MFIWREDARTEMLPWPEAVRRFGRPRQSCVWGHRAASPPPS